MPPANPLSPYPSRCVKNAISRGFTFARLKYQSGDWDADPQMPANLLNSMVEYTRLKVDEREHVVALDSKEVFAFPFVYMTGHALVRFSIVMIVSIALVPTARLWVQRDVAATEAAEGVDLEQGRNRDGDQQPDAACQCTDEHDGGYG